MIFLKKILKEVKRKQKIPIEEQRQELHPKFPQKLCKQEESRAK